MGIKSTFNNLVTPTITNPNPYKPIRTIHEDDNGSFECWENQLNLPRSDTSSVSSLESPVDVDNREIMAFDITEDQIYLRRQQIKKKKREKKRKQWELANDNVDNDNMVEGSSRDMVEGSSRDIGEGSSREMIESNDDETDILDLSMKNKLMKQSLESGLVGKQHRIKINELNQQRGILGREVDELELLSNQLELKRLEFEKTRNKERRLELEMEKQRRKEIRERKRAALKKRQDRERIKEKQRETERLEQENERIRLEQERLERERVERDRLERERLEQERIDQERIESERIEQERTDEERVRQRRRRREQRRERELARMEREKLEELPPYTPNLHKYLDLVSFDSRFSPVLRFNKSIIKRKGDLKRIIEQFNEMGVFPNEINPFELSLIDDRYFDDLIPDLIPEVEEENSIVVPQISEPPPMARTTSSVDSRNTHSIDSRNTPLENTQNVDTPSRRGNFNRSSSIGNNLILHDLNNYEIASLSNEDIRLIMNLTLDSNHSLASSSSNSNSNSNSASNVNSLPTSGRNSPGVFYNTSRIQLPNTC